MNDRVVNAESLPAASRAATRYSPHIRTALVLTGTGTAGAYHAGVLRALHEADLLAMRGRTLSVINAPALAEMAGFDPDVVLSREAD